MNTAVPSTALVMIQPAFTDAERLALAGFLAGYRGLTREAYGRVGGRSSAAPGGFWPGAAPGGPVMVSSAAARSHGVRDPGVTAGTRWIWRGCMFWGTAGERSRRCGWLAAWKTTTIHAARLKITTIGITMGARLDPVIVTTSSACACRFQRGEGAPAGSVALSH
jgi:hypothetical protein